MTGPSTVADVGRLRRVQTGARAILTLGIGASLAANVLAADPSLIGRVIAAWSPVALLLTVELLSRVPVAGGWLSRLRVLAAAMIAGIAAWVSYWHMAEVALSYGEASVAAHLLPFSVDGLVVVAAVCLVELGNRINDANAPRPSSRKANPMPQGGTAEAQSRRSTDSGKPLRETAGRSPNGNSMSPAAPSVNGARSSVGDEVRRLVAAYPEWTQAEVADRAGCSVRTVRRHLNTTDQHDDPSIAEGSNITNPTERPAAAEVAV